MSVFFEITAINHGNGKSGIDDFPSSQNPSAGDFRLFLPERNPDQHLPDLSTEYGFQRRKPKVPASAGGPVHADPKRDRQHWDFRMISNIFGGLVFYIPQKVQKYVYHTHIYIHVIHISTIYNILYIYQLYIYNIYI